MASAAPARSQIDGVPARACLTLAVQADGAAIRTVEGLAPEPGRLSVLQEAFRRHHALQCGFCTAGILMSLDCYLRATPDPTEAELRDFLCGHLCRCTGYAPIVAAALDAATKLREERRMLDLGTSFLASVARDPDALAIVDGARAADLCANGTGASRRVVAGLDALGLKPGDHLVTVLQNRWEAATLHWACQFAGIIITPVNWRATADELDFFCEDAEAKALDLRGRVGRGRARSCQRRRARA